MFFCWFPRRWSDTISGEASSERWKTSIILFPVQKIAELRDLFFVPAVSDISNFFRLVFRGFLKREEHAKIGSPVLGYGDGIWNLLHPSTVHASSKSYGTNRMNHQSSWSWRILKEQSETYFIRYCFYSPTLSVMDPVYAPFSATQKRYATLLPRIGSLCQ